jgi:DNA polymerase III subunit alpha
MPNVNLHQHSEGSFLDGEARPRRIFERARDLGMGHVAFTDHGECNQHLVGVKLAAEFGIGFIPGMEGYWLSDVRLNKAREDKKYPSPSHITLLAADNTGLKNLWALSSAAYNEATFYHKPNATPSLLKEYSQGIYASDGCMMTDFATAVVEDREDEARIQLGMLREIYKDRFFMELHTWQYIDLPEIPVLPPAPSAPTPAVEEMWANMMGAHNRAKDMHGLNAKMAKINQAKVRLAHELGVPLVVVNDSHHAYPEDWFQRELVWQFNTGKNPDQMGDAFQKADHLMDDAEIYVYMRRHGVDDSVISEAIANSHMIAEKCKVQIKPTLAIPKMAASDGDDLRNLIGYCKDGFQKYVVDEGLPEAPYMARLEEELTLISEKNFAGYFNMVRDYTYAYRSGSWSQFVKKGATKEPMLLGPARGSVGGSLVGYLLGIHIIDPIKYGTLFSRFLSPGRKGLPDVDVDLPRSQRSDALQYIGARFGHDHVCAIGILSRSGPKTTLKDVGRAMKVSFTDLNMMSEHIEAVEAMRDADDLDGEELTWGELIERKGGELRPWAQKYPELFERVGKMCNPKGLIRHAGVHAAGLLVSSVPLAGAVPMRRNTKTNVIATQFDMWEIEELGGVKLDLLGIRHLDTLSAARKMIHERHGVWIDYDRTGLSVPAGCTNVLKFGDAQFRDSAIWNQIDRGQTTGVFQVETPNCTNSAIIFKPRSEVDIADLTSIIRPGVADAGLKDVYLRRRAGTEPVVYDHPLMERFVGPAWVTDTYGVLVYQEQLMDCVGALAGFDADERDAVRSAVGKKLMDKLMAYKDKFIQGCLSNSDFMEFFTDGGFTVSKKATQTAHRIWDSIEASGRYAFNWCVSGDTQVKLGGSGSHSAGTMAVGEMWRRLHQLATPGAHPVGSPCVSCGERPSIAKGRGQCSTCYAWRRKFTSSRADRGLRSWSMGEDGRLHPNRILDVAYVGEAPVFRMTLEDGRYITTTAEHKHVTPGGERQLQELSVGDEVLVCGVYEQHRYAPGEYRLTGVEPTYAGARLPNSERHGTQSLGYRDGGHVALKQWTERHDFACSEPGCTKTVARGDRIERAHLDGNRFNNDPANLAMKCVGHHKAHDYRHNGRCRRGEKGYAAVPMRIVSIELVGVESVYDVEMDAPSHTWVGNGIITHNSHAVGYAIIATWEIWTKHYYPQEFLVALLATDPDNTNRYIREARRREVPVLPPDINKSARKFAIEGAGIRYGLDAVRGLGSVACGDVDAGRPYTSFGDFLERANKGAAMPSVYNLLRIGAFDELGQRAELLDQLERHRILADVSPRKLAKLTEVEKDEIWADKRVRLAKKYAVERPDFTDSKVVYEIEKELVGTYVTVDPLHRYLKVIDGCGLRDPIEVNAFAPKTEFIIAGQLTAIRPTVTKKGRNPGQEMAHITVVWNESDFRIVVFPEAWNRTKRLLDVGAPVACRVQRLDSGCCLLTVERLDWLFDRAGIA